jgi:hypothetical protein
LIYHRSENPPHANGEDEWLKEKITKIIMGIYKNK